MSDWVALAESIVLLRRTLRLLRDFYVAFHKPDWAEGQTADDMTDEIRIYLDQAARYGFAEAQVPPDGDDPGGPEEGDRD